MATNSNNLLGDHDVTAPVVERLGFLARTESMDMTNDPRFFQGNLLDKRLAAFGGLAVISGFMVDTAMGQVFDMNHDICIFYNPSIVDLVQFVAFVLFSFVLYANVLAMYIGVAQTYHAIRLMSAGPMGFESSKLYYLHPDIIFYRHMAVRLMLNSLWVFLVGAALRLMTRFSNDSVSGPQWASSSPEEPESTLDQPSFAGRLTVLGLCTCVFFIFQGITLYFTHRKHVIVFKGLYERLFRTAEPLLSHVAELPRGSANFLV